MQLTARSQRPVEPSRQERERPWRIAIIVAAIALVLVATAFLYVVITNHILLSNDQCDPASIDMTAYPTFRGYKFTIDGVSQLEELSSFEVSILKDNI